MGKMKLVIVVDSRVQQPQAAYKIIRNLILPKKPTDLLFEELVEVVERYTTNLNQRMQYL